MAHDLSTTPEDSRAGAATSARAAEGRRDESTALARMLLGTVSLLALALGVVGVLTSVDVLWTSGLLVFAVIGPGSAPWQLDAKMRLPERLLLSGVTTLAVLTLPSVGMVIAGSWHPAIAFAVVTVASVPLHVLAVTVTFPSVRGSWRSSRVRDRLVRRVWPRRPRRVSTTLLAVAGALLCLVAALDHRHLVPGEWGFLPRIGPLWFLGLVCVLASIGLARTTPERRLAVPVVLLVQVLTLTPALVYDGPRSQSTLKHVELAEMVRAGGGLHSAVAAYNAWPGFFSSTAWLSDVAHIADPLSLALFWPPLLALLRVAALRYLFGQLLSSPFQQWVAVTLAVLADAIGADYFSPQSVGFVLGLAAFGLALAPERRLLHHVMLFVVGWTAATTHQLSPFVIGGVLVVLVVFRQVRPWWTPLLVLVPAGVWTLTHLGSVSGFLSPELLGRLSNFRPPQTQAATGLERAPIIGLASYATLTGILVVGLLALVTLLQQRRMARAWALAVAPAVGLVLIAVNPYGNEGIFRAALFGIPWLAALAASQFPPRPSPLHRGLFLGVGAVLTVTFVVASFALDAFTVTRPADVAAVRYAATHPGGAYIAVYLGSGDLPTTVRPGEIVVTPDDLSAGPDGTSAQPGALAQLPPDQELQRIEDLLWSSYLANWQGTQPAVYALWSPVQSIYQEQYGLEQPSGFAALRDAVARSPLWSVAEQGDGTVLFRFDEARYAAAHG